MRLKWFSDCGHGWLEVGRAELRNLDIEQFISGFSYQKGSKVYLEEDCDATIFFEALFKEKEWYKKEENKEFCNKIPEEIFSEEAPIRNYRRYVG